MLAAYFSGNIDEAVSGGGMFRRLLLLVSVLLMQGCAVVSKPIFVESALVHGVDSREPVSELLLSHAQRCLTSQPLFWARYFNHGEITERLAVYPKATAHRQGVSLTGQEQEVLAAKNLRLLPIFAQNVNHLDGAAGERHGAINAADLANAIGAEVLRLHLKDSHLYYFLNQEPDNQPLTVDYWRGWVIGFARKVSELGANASGLRPGLYARPQNQSSLATVIAAIRADHTLPYAGMWLVSIDDENLKPSHPARTCGRLASWGTALPTLPDLGPILIRQYVLDARDDRRRSIDLNALNPHFSAELLAGMLLLPGAPAD